MSASRSSQAGAQDALTASPADAPLYLTPREVAALLRLSEKSVYRLVKTEPTMPALKVGSGKRASVRFPRERLMRWLDQRTQGSAHAMRQRVLSLPKAAPGQEPASA
jgi:excisionase family DNA binding protein